MELNTINSLLAGMKNLFIGKSSIIQNTEISDDTKIPSSVVTKNLQEQITQLNNNLAKNQFIDITNQCNFCYSITPIGIYGSFVKYNPYTKEIKGIIHVQENVGNQGLIMTLPSFIINTHYGLCGLGISPNNFTFVPRIVSNEIYSSHTMDTSVTQPVYLLDFIY